MEIIALIPAYNEEHVIGDVIKRALNHVDQVVVLDDGSSDNTCNVAKNFGAHVLMHEKNLGKGAAFHDLFDYAKKSNGNIFVTIDGDGQFLPEEIPKIIKPIKENNCDVVIGYRFETNEEMPMYRKVGNKFLDKMTNVASELSFRDTQSGFRAYSKKAIDIIEFSTKGFGVDSEILIDASKKDLIISEEKVTVIYNTGQKTSTENPVSHSVSVVSSILEQLAIKRPLMYLGLPGIIFVIIGIIFSITVMITFNEVRYFSVPFTLLSIGSLMVGILFVMVSIILFSISKISRKF